MLWLHRYALPGPQWLRNISLIKFHHKFLAEGLHGSSSHPGNTTWYQSEEDSEKPQNQLQTDFTVAHIHHHASDPSPLSPGFYFHNSNSPPSPYNQGALLSRHYAQEVILVDPFWVGPMHLSSLIPPGFSLYIDSICAESFSRDMTSSYHDNLAEMLEKFRRKFISAYGRNNQVPTTFSIARVSNFDHIPTTQFGVSAPRKGKNRESRSQMVDLVRNYRVRLCWGEQQPPPKSEVWKHGQCAENQSLSSVVAQCADLGLKNVVIDSLAMNKLGKLVAMCGNCRSYVSLCILRKHPTWKVVDVARKKKSS